MGWLRVDDRLFANQSLAAFGDFHRHGGIGLRRQDDEFFAAETRDQVTRAVQGQAQRLCDVHEAFVTLDMPIEVVVLLENSIFQEMAWVESRSVLQIAL